MKTYKRRLSFSQIISNGDNDLFKFLPSVKEFILTGSVRGGLEGIIDLLYLKSQTKVLLPVFIAEGVIRPFINKKVEIVYYKLTDDLNPDISDIKRQIFLNQDIKFMVVVHYFGFAYDFTQIKDICIDNKICLFEDCVHALFSRSKNDEYLGKTGDISFFSFPKILPVPDGAIFFINRPELLNIKSELVFNKGISNYIIIGLHLIYLLLKNIETKVPYSQFYKVMNTFSTFLYGSYYCILNHCPKPQMISHLTLRILKNINYDELIAKRKNHIKAIYGTLSNSKNTIFFKNYDPNVVLTGVPILSDNPTNIISILKRNNIECLTYKKRWLFVPPEYISKFSKEIFFYNRHFLLPVHENDFEYCKELFEVFTSDFYFRQY